MQAIMETIFDIGYLGAVIILGALMIKNCRGDRQFYLFGIMGVILGVGDDFFHYHSRLLYAALYGVAYPVSYHW